MKHRRTWQELRVWLGISTILIIARPAANRSLDMALLAGIFNWWLVAILAILILAGMVVILTIMLVRTRHQIAPEARRSGRNASCRQLPVEVPTQVEAPAPSETPAPEGAAPIEAKCSTDELTEAPGNADHEASCFDRSAQYHAEAQAPVQAPPLPPTEIPFRPVTAPSVPQFLEAITTQWQVAPFPAQPGQPLDWPRFR